MRGPRGASQADVNKIDGLDVTRQWQVAMFDLDDTLCASKTTISPEMAHMLRSLLGVVDVCIISGGRFEQFEVQVLKPLGVFPELRRLHLMPTSGARYLRWEGVRWNEIYFERLSESEKERAFKVLRDGAEEFGFWLEDTWGPALEDRGSQVTYSALGQKAPVEEKAKWDPDKKKGHLLREYAAQRLGDLEVRSGGSTSIDVTKAGIDKAYGTKKLMAELAIAETDILFFGDRLDPGGNDYPVKALGVECIAVKGWKDTISNVQAIFRLASLA